MARSSRVVVGVLLCLFYPAWVQGLGQPARFVFWLARPWYLLWVQQAWVGVHQRLQVGWTVHLRRPWQALWQLRSALGALQESRSEYQLLLAQRYSAR